jgi:hypothetical protein
MQLHRLTILLFSSLLFLTISCDKTCTDPDAEAAILTDYTGLDGCGWVIKLENDEVLEPMNLGSFDIELKEGKEIWITYTELQDVASICMVGPIVRIDEIWDR